MTEVVPSELHTAAADCRRIHDELDRLQNAIYPAIQNISDAVTNGEPYGWQASVRYGMGDAINSIGGKLHWVVEHVAETAENLDHGAIAYRCADRDRGWE